MSGLRYEIRVQGPSGPDWQEEFEDIAIQAREDGAYVLRTKLIDPPALYGLLERVRAAKLRRIHC